MPTLGTKRMMMRMERSSNKRSRYTAPYSARRRNPLPETKFVTTTISHSATNSSTTNVNLTSNGPDNGERIGRKTKTLFIEGLTQSNDAGQYRVILYRPKLASAQLSLTNIHDPVDPESFTVLKEFWVTLETNQRVSMFKHKLPFGQNTSYSGALTTSVEDGPIKMLIKSGNATINGYVRAWYIDN